MNHAKKKQQGKVGTPHLHGLRGAAGNSERRTGSEERGGAGEESPAWGYLVWRRIRNS